MVALIQFAYLQFTQFNCHQSVRNHPGPLRPVEARLLTSYLFFMVGLGGFEPPTSRLSGVRSNQLSYRPEAFAPPLRRGRTLAEAGGADRARTDDLLNANQALSQLSYSPLGWQELALPFGKIRGRLDAATGSRPDDNNICRYLRREIGTTWSGTAATY